MTFFSLSCVIHMIIFFFHLVSSTLEPTDDPYAILNVSRNANKTTIKEAYRRLTQKYHPDISKKNGSIEMWMKINDAFEILSNPDRKLRYDQTGKVDIEDDLKLQPFGTNFNYRGKYTSGDIQPQTPLINNINFDDFVSNGNETLLLFYSSNISELTGYLELFETFNERYNKLWQLGRVDMALGLELARQLNVIAAPTFVYVRAHNKTIINPDNLNEIKNVLKKTIYQAPRPLLSIEEILSFLTSETILPTHLFTIKTKDELNKFLTTDPLTPHIFQLTRSLTLPRFKKIASAARDIILFAEVIDSDFSIGTLFNITIYPALIAIRAPNAPYIIEYDMKKMGAFINDYGVPTGFEFEFYSSMRLCQESCFVQIINSTEGFDESMAKQISTMNYSIGWAPLSSPKIQELGFKNEGE